MPKFDLRKNPWLSASAAADICIPAKKVSDSVRDRRSDPSLDLARIGKSRNFLEQQPYEHILNECERFFSGHWKRRSMTSAIVIASPVDGKSSISRSTSSGVAREVSQGSSAPVVRHHESLVELQMQAMAFRNMLLDEMTIQQTTPWPSNEFGDRRQQNEDSGASYPARGGNMTKRNSPLERDLVLFKN
jgi:hypothetical protein